MDKTAILALIDAIINNKLESESFKGERGPRGFKGLPGKDFDFDEHKIEILNLIKQSVIENKDNFRLTEEEKLELKLNFSDLTYEEKSELRGPRGPKGQKGKPGRDFDFDEHREIIFNQLISFIDQNINRLKLKFSDLSQEEKDLLKLKFSDLTDEEIYSLKGERGLKGQRGDRGEKGEDGKDGEQGPRGEKGERGEIGQKGKSGVDGKSAYEIWLQTNDGTEEEFLNSLKGEDGKDGEQGPRGQKGKSGVDGKSAYDSWLIYNDGTEEEFLNSLKGQKGDEGQRGPRGQRGKLGKDGKSAYEVWSKYYDGDEDVFLSWLKGEKGQRGERGVRGQIGLQGIQGERGEKGEDGKDAPRIVEIEVKQRNNKEKLSFIFIFSDGTEIVTDEISLPTLTAIYSAIASTGGSGGGLSALPIEQNDTAIGNASTLNFVNLTVEVDDVDSTKINVTANPSLVIEEDDTNIGTAQTLNFVKGDAEVDDIDSTKINYTPEITVYDEGVLVSDEVQIVNFIGDNVQVIPANVIADWPSLDVVDSMATYGGDPKSIDVLVSGVAEKLSKKFVAGEPITQNQFIYLGASQEAFIATNDGTYEEAQVRGIALGTVTTGVEVDVLLFGVLEDGAFSYTINNPFFLGVNGASIQNPPTSVGEFVVELGQSLGTGAIFLEVKRPQEIVS